MLKKIKGILSRKRDRKRKEWEEVLRTTPADNFRLMQIIREGSKSFGRRAVAIINMEDIIVKGHQEGIFGVIIKTSSDTFVREKAWELLMKTPPDIQRWNLCCMLSLPTQNPFQKKSWAKLKEMGITAWDVMCIKNKEYKSKALKIFKAQTKRDSKAVSLFLKAFCVFN